ncbi:hypothetical protein GCM10009759_52900 [Kitasatospora saccharophila]|uniref:HEAT repeat protein n=1 Tax=Kitasatospora saccharophila TaxID=407973 RepID=A0ABN2XH23_9ACTN
MHPDAATTDATTDDAVEIAALVADLDAESTATAEEAQYGLIHLGPQVLDAVIAATPTLNPFGQLCAIEVFNAFDDRRPGEVLIGLLESGNAVVRQWSAEALGRLRVEAAVPALRRTYAEFNRRGEAPDDCEGGALREALTELGARREVVPPRVRELSVDGEGWCWPAARLPEVIGELAAHGQAVLYFMPWEVRPDGSRYGGSGPGIDWDVDRSWPWERLVEHCRDWALLAAEAVEQGPELVATICWIDAADL